MCGRKGVSNPGTENGKKGGTAGKTWENFAQRARRTKALSKMCRRKKKCERRQCSGRCRSKRCCVCPWLRHVRQEGVSESLRKRALHACRQWLGLAWHRTCPFQPPILNNCSFTYIGLMRTTLPCILCHPCDFAATLLMEARSIRRCARFSQKGNGAY
jgi:hypothetical protein